MDVPPMREQSGAQGPSGPLSGVEGPSGPLSGVEGPSGPLSGVEGPSGPWNGAEELDWRLAGLEGRLDAISERVERLESTIRSSVADEVKASTDDLRRTITQLGRLLVKDLPQELARHRDAIVAELRPPLPPEPEPQPQPEPEPVAPEAEPPDVDLEPVVAEETEAATVERRRASRRRRRHG